MIRGRTLLIVLGIGLATWLLACTSPEAERTRGGGPGADIGNRGAMVEMHEGAHPYFQTPCVTTLDQCTGPLPVFRTLTSDRAYVGSPRKTPSGERG